MKNQKEFRYQLFITLLDKLLIAVAIVLVGYFINKSLKRIESNEAIKVEGFKNELTKERLEFQNRLSIARDSMEKIYQESRNELEKKYLENRNDLMRREDRFFDEQMLQLENQSKIQIEALKNNNSFNSFLLRTAFEKTSETWEAINKISLGSKLVQSKLYNFNQLIKENFDEPINLARNGGNIKESRNFKEFYQRIPNKIAEGTLNLSDFTEREIEALQSYLKRMKLLHDRNKNVLSDSSSIEDQKKVLEFLKLTTENEIYINALQEDLEVLLRGDTLTFDKKIPIQINIEKFKSDFVKLFYRTIGADIDELLNKIVEGENKIQANHFWLDNNSSERMMTFLAFYLEYLYTYPFARSDDERSKLNKEIARYRQNVFDIKDELYQKFINESKFNVHKN